MILVFFQALANLIGQGEFLPNSAFFHYFLSDAMCQPDSVAQLLCLNTLFLTFGYSRNQMNTTLLPMIFKYVPAGASTKQIFHYSQEVKSGKYINLVCQDA